MRHSGSALAILIPAAGASRRMAGRDKLLEPVAGRPILRRIARLCVTSGCDTLVTLPTTGPFGTGRSAALSGLPVHQHGLIDADEGLSASLRVGAQFAKDAQGLMVVLPDMPDIDLADLNSLLEMFAADRKTPLRAASQDGKPGHPVIIPHRLFPHLAQLHGDKGARDLLANPETRLCPLSGLRAITDLDTPEDWAAWRARQSPAPAHLHAQPGEMPT